MGKGKDNAMISVISIAQVVVGLTSLALGLAAIGYANENLKPHYPTDVTEKCVTTAQCATLQPCENLNECPGGLNLTSGICGLSNTFYCPKVDYWSRLAEPILGTASRLIMLGAGATLIGVIPAIIGGGLKLIGKDDLANGLGAVALGLGCCCACCLSGIFLIIPWFMAAAYRGVCIWYEDNMVLNQIGCQGDCRAAADAVKDYNCGLSDKIITALDLESASFGIGLLTAFFIVINFTQNRKRQSAYHNQQATTTIVQQHSVPVQGQVVQGQVVQGQVVAAASVAVPVGGNEVVNPIKGDNAM